MKKRLLPTALPPRPVRPTTADSIASARERIPIELAFLGKRIFYKGYTTTTKARREDIILEKVEGRRRAPSKRYYSLKAATG